MHVFCDFDGTISLKDTTDEILTRYADPEWEAIEQEWKEGAIGSAECMRRQIPLIRASKATLDDALDGLEIDPTFPEFVNYCEDANLPLTVISDGVDYFIQRILGRYHLGHLPVIANRLTISPEGRYQLSSPFGNPDCTFESGVCKCRQIGSRTGMRIFVGDGRSDFCAAGSADVLFAKHTLARHCTEQRIHFHPYQQFCDVQSMLEQVILPVHAEQMEPLRPLAVA